MIVKPASKDSMMGARPCSQCGALHPSDAPEGICPHCEFQGALAAGNDPLEPPPIGQGFNSDAPFDPKNGATGGCDAASPKLRSFGDYEILAEIARGGMGVVYKARQKSLDRVVALKMILAAQFASKSFISRFRVEAAAAASLQHPNIVRIHEVGLYEGQHFFSMDYIAGQNLTQLVGNRPLSARQAARYIKITAEAIHYAHEQGILHRDLQPSNILIDSATGLPHVTDFGLAKRLDGETNLTVAGQLLGSPQFMPPEQASGRDGKIGRPSDVYGLGAVLFYLLTARALFQAESMQEVVRQVADTEPVSPRLLNPAVPHDLETICLKCLEKEPARRYQTARELASDLDHFLRDEPIVARPVTRLEGVWRWSRRKPVVASLSVATALLVIAVGIGSPVAAWRINQARQQFKLNVIRQYVSNGTRLANEGDLFESLLWYAEALRLDAGDPKREEPHRIRIASVLRQCPKLLQVFSHGTMLYDAEFSSDGERLVTASDDHTARVWDVTTGAQLLALKHDGSVSHATFNFDGSRILTSSEDKTARLWDARTGAQLQSLVHQDKVWSGCFSSDGHLLATACQDKTAQLWDAATGQRVHEPLMHEAVVVQVTFSPDGRFLGATTAGGTAAIWDVATGEKLFQPAHTANLKAVAFSPDSQRLLTADGSNLHVWNSDDGKFTNASYSPLQSPTLDLSFGPDGRSIIAAGEDGAARVWDAASGQPLFQSTIQHAGPITGVSISGDGRRFATAGNDSVVRLWKTHTGQPLSPPLKFILVASHVDFNPDGRRVLGRSCDQAARVWDMATSDLAGPPRSALENEQRLVSSDGRLALRFGESNTVWIADVKSGHRLARLPHANDVTYASFSRDGRTVVTATEEQSWVSSMRNDIFLWDSATGHRLNTNEMAHKFLLLYAAFSPDNQRLLTCSFDFTARLWNARTGEPLSQPLPHRGRVFWGAFSPDGQRVVTSSWDKTVRVWDGATGMPLTPPLLHKAPVLCASWSTDGKRLTTLTEDDDLQVWELSTGEPLTLPTRVAEPGQLRLYTQTPAAAQTTDDLPRDDRPVADLVLLAQMLAVGRIDEAGNVVPLRLHELTEASQLLRARYPPQFAATHSEILAWHEAQARQSQEEGNLRAALFHLDQALLVQPKSAMFIQERIELAAALAQGTNTPLVNANRAKRFPVRDPKAGPQQIDLTPHYNLGLQELDLRGLATGLQLFGGVRFDVRGIVHLKSQARDYNYPRQVNVFRVGQKCTRLHFLQATSGDDQPERQVGKYILHYADGEIRELPIVYGQDLANYWFRGAPAIKQSASAITVWTGMNRDAAQNLESICLYQSTRENPRPRVELVSIDFVSSIAQAAPFLVALTVE
jgi:WD40 repeat protein/serine/threonine protein kinase